MTAIIIFVIRDLLDKMCRSYILNNILYNFARFYQQSMRVNTCSKFAKTIVRYVLNTYFSFLQSQCK